jgi:hypothetical protein
MASLTKFSAQDHWKAVTLYGLNTATYKIALAKSLLHFCQRGLTRVSWDDLSAQFFNEYLQRLESDSPMPQMGQPGRLTEMEKIIAAYKTSAIDQGAAIERVGKNAFQDVIPRFHNVGSRGDLSESMFYRFDFGTELVLTDDIHSIADVDLVELDVELDARWSLLEGAYSLMHHDFQLANDLRLIYIKNSTHRKNLTGNIGFLQGYQGNTCFYCGLPIPDGDAHVDHILPRQVIEHDHIWNLVLAHSYCNQRKSDRIVGKHFIAKLIARNENIMGSNHPWKQEIVRELGNTPMKRYARVKSHYDRVGQILNWTYWEGDPHYSPQSDSFYKRLVTLLNNKEIR